MAVTFKESEPNAYRFIPDTYAFTVRKESEETATPSLLNGNQLRDMLRLRVRSLARDIRNAVEDGGLNEEGFAIDTSLWSECIEDITYVLSFLDSELKLNKEVSLKVYYPNSEPWVWTISRVEKSA